MSETILLLGGNISDRFFYLEKACEWIENHVGKIVKKSSLFETEPWGFLHENSFLNQVIIVQTKFLPEEVLRKILRIEKILGRVRSGKGYSARTIDIDILFYENQCITKHNLIIPHPHLHKRRFTLAPLSEILPNYIHPILKKTSAQLLGECPDASKVYKIQKQISR